MKTSTANVKKALLDLASIDTAVLNVTPKAQAALKGKKLDHAERTLLERIDGFRSLEQLLAMSGDLTSVHAILGQLMVSGYAVSETPDDEEADVPFDVEPLAAEPVEVKPVAPKAASAKPVAAKPGPVKAAKAAPVTLALAPDEPDADEPILAVEPDGLDEVGRAKQLLLMEAKRFLGPGAEKLRSRIEQSQSIADVYDLIVKVREHITKTGKGDPNVFLEDLITGLAFARKKSPSAQSKKRS
jgi:hypothetical protein